MVKQQHQTQQHQTQQHKLSMHMASDIMQITDNPHLHINITHSNTMQHTLGYSIIPILITHLNNTHLFNK